MEKEISFKDLGLDNWLANQCGIVGLHKPTPVQQKCIPAVLQGRDCIGCAKTGSGKTAAFALPILQKLAEDPYGIFAVVLTPTRELAYQIYEQLRALGKPLGLRLSIIIGGMSLVDQGSELSQKPHIVIATPGRLADHIRSNTSFTMKRVKFLVLDEADRLLVKGFSADLALILGAISEKRQTLMFSATINETIEDAKCTAMSNPFIFDLHSRTATVEELDQRFILTPAMVKDAYLIAVVQDFLEKNPKSLIIVFVQTCKICETLSIALRDLGFNATGLHSMMKQKERISAIARFKSHAVRILVSTDVGSRGLDIPKVDLVINHNIPPIARDYIHRVGRTARGRKGGMSLCLVTQFDVRLVQAIEDVTGVKMVEYPLDEKLVDGSFNEVQLAVRQAGIRLQEEDFDEKRLINKRKDALIRQWETEAEAQAQPARLDQITQRKKSRTRQKE